MFFSAVRELVDAKDEPSAQALISRVKKLSAAIQVPHRLRGRERRNFKMFRGAGDEGLRSRLNWLVGNTHPSVTSDLEIVAAAVGVAYDENLLAFCGHACEGESGRTDRFLNRAQCKGDGADAFRTMVRDLTKERLGARGTYPLG